jgi:hypothetical protein
MCGCRSFPVFSSDLLLKKKKFPFPFPEMKHLCLVCLLDVFRSLGPVMQDYLLRSLPNIESDIRTHYLPLYTDEERLAITSTITQQQAVTYLQLNVRSAEQMMVRLKAEDEENGGEEEEEKEEKEEERGVKKEKKKDKKKKEKKVKKKE